MPEAELTWHAATAANLLDARRKNGRLGSRKSRAGCTTCKIRKVKCDESRPECNKCKSTGRKCGYADSPPPSKKNTSLVGSHLSLSLGLKESERRTFDFFLSWTAPRLAGSLDKDFWSGYVLQLARVEPLVLNSLLAISTLYEHPQYLASFRTEAPSSDSKRDGHSTNTISRSPPLDDNHLNALKYYNRAIQGFKKRVESGNATPLLAILSCMLFICIEVIRDDVFAALSLFTRGAELLATYGSTASNDNEREVFKLVKLMFARLGVLTSTFGHQRPIDTPFEAVAIGRQAVFETMSEARTALFELMVDSHAYLRDAEAWKISYVVNRYDSETSPGTRAHEGVRVNMFDSISNVTEAIGLKEIGETPSETGNAVLPGTINLRTGDGISTAYRDEDVVDELASLLQQTQLQYQTKPDVCETATEPNYSSLLECESNQQKRLGRWLDAFRWPLSSSEPESASYLLMYYHTSYIWQSTRLSLSQFAFDDFSYHFREIIRHAQVYIKSKAVEDPIFTFEIGAVPPLYFAAAKCRIPSVRRQALDLLTKAPRKECMWGANNSAELVSRLILIEEEGLGLPQPDCSGNCAFAAGITDSVLPPEEQRVHNLEILRNKTMDRFEVRITRYTHLDGRLKRHVEDYPI